tara:strand:+ start:53 stop:403 length:351 start_codon:yes stop_codon:yes gene_type:complete
LNFIILPLIREFLSSISTLPEISISSSFIKTKFEKPLKILSSVYISNLTGDPSILISSEFLLYSATSPNISKESERKITLFLNSIFPSLISILSEEISIFSDIFYAHFSSIKESKY